MGVQVSDPGPPPLSRSGAMDTLAGQRRQWDQDPCSGRSPCCFARTGSGRDGNGTLLYCHGEWLDYYTSFSI